MKINTKVIFFSNFKQNLKKKLNISFQLIQIFYYCILNDTFMASIIWNKSKKSICSGCS